MRGSSYQILSYRVRHSYDIGDFLESCRNLLQRAVDEIWGNIEWIERRQRNYYVVKRGRRKVKRYYYAKRLIPVLPKSREFKRSLRRQLLGDWGYASHYVDSAIRTAYSILNSWRRNYVKGRRGRRKPIVRRRFVRVKKTLYSFKDWKIKVTVKPYKLYLEFDLSRAWFRRRVEGCDLGELILKEGELIVTFRKPIDDPPKKRKVAWDLNLLSMDGFCDRGWVRVDLKPLYTLHITYENLRRKIQRLTKTKPRTAERLKRKYSERYRNRVRDFLHKLTTKLAREFRDYEHGFEDLEKRGMFNRRKVHNRAISRQNWKQIIGLMSYKASVKLLNPRNSTRTCPRCGGRMMRRRGQVLECMKCGLVINRQLNASINLFLRMWGFHPSMRVWLELIEPILRRSGVTPKGCKACDMLPMNPEGDEVDAHQGGFTSIKDYIR